VGGGKNVVITISACLLHYNKCFLPFKDAESPLQCMSFLHVRMLANPERNGTERNGTERNGRNERDGRE